MDNKLVISYTPDQIDEAVKQHIERTTGYTGDALIDYTHKRTLKKVSAQITLSDPVRVSRAAGIPLARITEIPAVGGVIEPGNYEKLAMREDHSIEFGDLPVHEQEEATQPIQGQDLEEDLEADPDNIMGTEEDLTVQEELEELGATELAADFEEYMEANADEYFEYAEMEAEDLRKESREADSEVEVPEEIETENDDDMESLFK